MQFCMQAGNWAGGKDHEWGVLPNLDQVALQLPSQHIGLETDVAILQQVNPQARARFCISYLIISAYLKKERVETK